MKLSFWLKLISNTLSSFLVIREHLDGVKGKILDFNQHLEISIGIAHDLTFLHLYAGIMDKIVESLCRKRKDQLLLHTLPSRESSLIESENIYDELDLRIALQSTRNMVSHEAS